MHTERVNPLVDRAFVGDIFEVGEELIGSVHLMLNVGTSIRNVIFSGPATIVFWNDGTKTVVKCQPGDDYDRHMGLAMACAKKLLGNTGSYYEVFKKWIPGAYQDVQPARKATKEEWEEFGKYLKGEEILVQSAQTDSKSVREIVQSAQKEEMSPLAEKIGGCRTKQISLDEVGLITGRS